jgi:hypothetical protein
MRLFLRTRWLRWNPTPALSMEDASMFKTRDGRFPHTYGQVTDLCVAYACLVGVYMGWW